MVNQLLDCQLVLPVKSALKSLSRLILSDCNDGIEIQTDLLNHASFFLSTDSDILIGRSLSVFLDVFRISNEDLINSLIHTKIFEFIRNPLIHENSTLQASASYLLVKLVASNKQFEEIALSSDLIDIICKNALDSEFKSREQAVSTICEFIQCRHSVSMIEHIKNCGGLLAISVALGGATDENAKDIINAVHHVVTQMPCEMDTFLEYGLLNELEDILSTPDELLSDDVFNAADTLREEIISYLNAENVE
ncbi:hypothetical protein GPJ56_003527 [Histomonas meleagridis]|uniref:uncharacterized protein n=1 Tax=Histomonas meleagridis TaxID=135588 RepID=UPI00355A3936|nr:hypothetical protein GPJ56_003527 [Histomonas meleagridis]KAH0806413.1 hypothetical protein GO595_000788 [Histomonas meleagridis]